MSMPINFDREYLGCRNHDPAILSRPLEEREGFETGRKVVNQNFTLSEGYKGMYRYKLDSLLSIRIIWIPFPAERRNRANFQFLAAIQSSNHYSDLESEEKDLAYMLKKLVQMGNYYTTKTQPNIRLNRQISKSIPKITSPLRIFPESLRQK